MHNIADARFSNINNQQAVQPNVFYETINSNFWWSTSNTGVYIPLANSENSCSSSCANAEVSGKMSMQSVKLMPNKGKIKKISFSITKTNPEGIPNPQFNIISGKAIDYDCDSSVGGQELECANKLYFIDELGQEVRDRVEGTNFTYPQWEDTYHIYTKMGSSYPSQPCCYPSSAFNPSAGNDPSNPAKYNTPQKFITYSYDLKENNHYDAGTYLAIQMDKGGAEGLACYQGDINQAIFVSILLENEI